MDNLITIGKFEKYMDNYEILVKKYLSLENKIKFFYFIIFVLVVVVCYIIITKKWSLQSKK